MLRAVFAAADLAAVGLAAGVGRLTEAHARVHADVEGRIGLAVEVQRTGDDAQLLVVDLDRGRITLEPKNGARR
jgi:hypothetical protein